MGDVGEGWGRMRYWTIWTLTGIARLSVRSVVRIKVIGSGNAFLLFIKDQDA